MNSWLLPPPPGDVAGLVGDVGDVPGLVGDVPGLVGEEPGLVDTALGLRPAGIENGSRPAKTTCGEIETDGLPLTDGDGSGDDGGSTGPGDATSSAPPVNRLKSRNSTRMPPSTGPGDLQDPLVAFGDVHLDHPASEGLAEGTGATGATGPAAASPSVGTGIRAGAGAHIGGVELHRDLHRQRTGGRGGVVAAAPAGATSSR